ncbi:MAG: hydroxymethylbilane synthase [Crocinitomicaceae bacterium]|jgi:hydroxymethylbilane synthase|nr:hydroxymethylbilane synthase [Crocinitomicaceae bacterium]
MQTNPKIRIGTRGSDLALWQAYFVRRQLEEIGCEVSFQIIVTQGDRIQDLSFDKLEGKGFFTKEIEQALLNGDIDLAVHSHKDLETTQPSGLHIAAVSYREDASELLLMRREAFDAQQAWNLKTNAVIGTSSARRKAQILAQRPDLAIKELRGNVPTRIEKLRQGQYDAILLARAGVLRLELDLSDLETIVLDPSTFIPAPAQGVLGLQTRVADEATNKILQKLHHADVATRIELERSVLRQMDGGCQLPLGVYCVDDHVYVSFSPASTLAATNRTYSYVPGQETELAFSIVQELKK